MAVFRAKYIVSDRSRALWSADIDTKCVVPRTNTRLSDRSFTVAGPRFWNTSTLPAELRQPDMELLTFRRRLKTNLFRCDPGAYR